MRLDFLKCYTTQIPGDLSYSTGFLSRWDSWLNMMEPVTARVPLMTTPGNHERDDVKTSPFYADGTTSLWAKNDAGGECGVPYAVSALFGLWGLVWVWMCTWMGPQPFIHIHVHTQTHTGLLPHAGTRGLRAGRRPLVLVQVGQLALHGHVHRARCARARFFRVYMLCDFESSPPRPSSPHTKHTKHTKTQTFGRARSSTRGCSRTWGASTARPPRGSSSWRTGRSTWTRPTTATRTTP